MEKAPEDLRKKLAAAIPQAAHLPWRGTELQRQSETGSALLWNVAADLWINALLGDKRLEQAGKFLQTHPRIKLTEPYKSMERNFVKIFRIFRDQFSLKINRARLWLKISHSREVKNQVFCVKNKKT